jgi:hypothetical protein
MLYLGGPWHFKTTMKSRNALIAAAICFSCNPALAAPGGLLNKTIQISYAMFIPGRTANGSINRSGRTVSLTIYVSGMGRIFFKAVNRCSQGDCGRVKLSAPESTSKGWRFAGSALVGVVGQNGSVAMQIKASFDSGFQSCSAEVIVGEEVGVPTSWTALDGERFTATGKPSISSVACSVASGNAFAN